MSFTPFKNFLHRAYILQSVLLWAKTLRPQPKTSTKLEAIPFNNEHGTRQLQTMFSVFEKAEVGYPTAQTYGTGPSLSPESRALFETTGFWLERRTSRISGAGHGVFLHGKARAGDIVCMYPGTIYFPGEPILFVSLRNSYILRCYDGIFVDGKSDGLSRRIYNSLYLRNNYPGAIETNDRSWMSDQPKNPLAVGQIVNNGTSHFPANVGYQELDLPTTFPLHLQRYLPNIYNVDRHEGDPIRAVALVATREVADEELFSTYLEVVG